MYVQSLDLDEESSKRQLQDLGGVSYFGAAIGVLLVISICVVIILYN